MMKKHLETEIKVGLFVMVGLVLTMLSILLLGDTGSWFSKNYSYAAHFSSVEGLIPGAKVILSGVNVGSVDTVEFDPNKRDIKVLFSVSKDALAWIRQDSTVEIATQGILGDKFISIGAGTEAQPQLPPGSDISSHPTKDLSQFISKGDQLMMALNRIATNLDNIVSGFEAENRSEIFFKNLATISKNLSDLTGQINQQVSEGHLKASLEQLEQIFEKINHGNGTLGALINDPSLYDEARAFIGGANRNRVLRNLIRQTIQNSNDSPETASPH